MNKQVPLDPFQNVVASGTAICDLNKFLGSVVEKFTFTLGGTSFTKSMISNIVLKGNGKALWETDGSKLDSSNQFFFVNADATILKMDYLDRRGVTPGARQAGAFDLSFGSGITSLRLEVTISGATAPTLVGFADVSKPDPNPNEAAIRPLITRRHRATYPVAAAGTFALPIPHMDPAGGGSNFRRIFLYSANCTGFKTVREGTTEHELTKLQNEAAQKDNLRTPQANLVVFDPCQDGQMSDRTWDTRPTSGVKSAQFYATFSGAETITIETEELIPFNMY